jgi:hypothetical protein
METPPPSPVFSVDPVLWQHMQGMVERSTGGEINQMTFDQAAGMIAWYVVQLTQFGEGRVLSPEGKNIIDSKLDGTELLRNYGEQRADRFTQDVAEARELTIRVLGHKSLWSRFRGHGAPVIKTFSFQREAYVPES